MKSAQLNALKVGDCFRYRGRIANVIYRGIPYPSDWRKDDNGNLVEIPDKDVTIGFTCDGEDIGRRTSLDAKMIVDSKFYDLDHKDYQPA